MKKFLSVVTTVLIAAGWTFVTVRPAAAFCHLSVSFSKPNYEVKENEGSVTITINRGQIVGAGCTATIEYSTSDGTAKAPSDYKATSCADCKILNPTQPSYTFTVPIVDDTAFEGNEPETFNVKFKHTPDNGSSVATGSAKVAIQDNDPAPAVTRPPPAGTSPKPSPTVTTPSPTATAAAMATPGSPLPLEEASPEESPTVAEEKAADEDDGAPTGLIVAAIAIVLAAGAGIGLWFLRRTPA